MDIVSLAPSATETLLELDAGEDLVASVETRNLPSHVKSLGGWLTTPTESIAEYDPDLVITTDALQEDQQQTLKAESGYAVLHLDPRTLEETVTSIQEIASRVGREQAGARLCEEFTTTLTTLREKQPSSEPVIYCEEWSNPPMVAGNWVPDVVSAAGGSYPFLESGVRSRPITQSEFERHAPDIAILHICGRGDTVEPARLTDREWDAPACPNHVHVLDDAVLNQPSPLLLDGLKRISDIVTEWDTETK